MKKAARTLQGLGMAGLLAVALGATGCQTGRSRSLAQQWGDRQVASGVKRELSRDPLYKYPDVRPTVYEGTVQLGGFVDTPEQRHNAAQLAVHAKGVRQVVNCIHLAPPPVIWEECPDSAAPCVSSGGASVWRREDVQASPPMVASASARAAVKAPVPAAVPAPALAPPPAQEPPRSAARVRAVHPVPTQGAGAAALLGRPPLRG